MQQRSWSDYTADEKADALLEQLESITTILEMHSEALDLLLKPKQPFKGV